VQAGQEFAGGGEDPAGRSLCRRQPELPRYAYPVNSCDVIFR